MAKVPLRYTFPVPNPERVTELLQAWRTGDRQAEADLLPLIYDELRSRAARYLRRERPDHTLQPTALVHEAYMRLVDQRAVAWQDRTHFFAIAAKMMRRVLLDHARKHGSEKRGGGHRPLALEAAVEVAEDLPALAPADLVALDAALTALAAFDPERARIVELRFFGGLTLDETAAVLGCSPATVMRQWRTARAWLYAELEGDGEARPAASAPPPLDP